MAEEAQTQPSIPSESHQSSSSNAQATDTSGHHSSLHSDPQMSPSMNISAVAAFLNQEQMGHGQGLYAVQFSPFMGTAPECSPSILIPLTYKIPTRTNSVGAAGEEQGQGLRQQNGPQRQVVVRRFQLDLALLLKLIFAVTLFSQDGSRQRTIILVFLASLVYLYQTGALTPLFQYTRRVLAPPQPPARPQHAANRQDDDNAAGIGNENQPREEANQQQPEPEPERERGNGINWLGIAREIQTFVVGFIASLFPGFEHHNHND